MEAITRTSTWISCSSPTRRKVPSCKKRSSLICKCGLISPISSRNTVPPLACSKIPL
ncbi:Uncharacterised protein [Vibrio cholerae]|nr:Uncharacterised protein [Vibrio cholerae]